MAIGDSLKDGVSVFPAALSLSQDSLIVLLAFSFPALVLAIPFGVSLAARNANEGPSATVAAAAIAAALGFTVYALYETAVWPLAGRAEWWSGWVAAGYFVLASLMCSELWRLMFLRSGQPSRAEGALG
jgi:hypothetical protein